LTNPEERPILTVRGEFIYHSEIGVENHIEARKPMGSAKKTVALASLAALWLTVLQPSRVSALPAAPGRGPGAPLAASFSLSGAGGTPGLFSAAGPFPLSVHAANADAGDSGRSAAGGSRRPKKRTLRAWLELGAFLAYTTTSYWVRAAFPEDWQFELNFGTQLQRILGLEGWRFDSNNFRLNWTHTLAGAIYYEFARTNHLSWFDSWMMGIISSTYWEAIVEWKEVISLNDQIMTGLGSYATGEPVYQIGRFLSYQPGFFYQALSFLNPLVKINRWLDRHDPADRADAPHGWHDFTIFAGARQLSRSGQDAQTDTYFGFRTQLIGLPEYGKAGEVEGTVKDTYFSEIALDYAERDGHADETRFLTKAVTLGIVRQNINENLEGTSLTLGVGSSFEYFKKRPIAPYDSNPVSVKSGWDPLLLDQPRDFTDKLAILNVAGPVLDWTVFRRGLKLRTVLEAYLNFSLVNAYALNKYSESHDIVGMKTTVFYYGYYYGYGGTFSGSMDLQWGNFRARAVASYNAWGSFDGLDRFQAEVTNNAHLSDTRTRYLLGVGWKIPRAPLELFLNFEGVRRSGRIQEVVYHDLEKKAYAGLLFSF
jgi:hypothetical protein